MLKYGLFGYGLLFSLATYYTEQVKQNECGNNIKYVDNFQN